MTVEKQEPRGSQAVTFGCEPEWPHIPDRPLRSTLVRLQVNAAFPRVGGVPVIARIVARGDAGASVDHERRRVPRPPRCGTVRVTGVLRLFLVQHRNLESGSPIAALKKFVNSERQVAVWRPPAPREGANGDVMKSAVWSGVTTCALAATLGAIAATYPVALLALPALVIAYLLRFPTARLLWLVLGGMVSLQSSQGLNALKLAYFGGVVIATFASYSGMNRVVKVKWGRLVRPVLVGAALIGLVVLIGVIVSLETSSASLTDVSRDVLTYLLAICAVVISIDAAGRLSSTTVERLIVGITLLAAVGFSVAWLGRRQSTGLQTDQFILASVMLLVPGFALGLIRGTARSKGRPLWLALTVVAVASILITGTRAGLVLGAAFVGVLGSRKKARISLGRLLPGAVLIGGITAIALTWLSSTLGLNDFLMQRLAVAQQTLTNGWSADQSGSTRLKAGAIGMNIWQTHWWFGVGFGQSFPNPEGPGTVPFAFDSASLYLAKFGVVGTAILAASVVFLARWAIGPALAVGSRPLWVPGQAAIRGAVAVWLATLVFGPFTEDKGWGLSLSLLLVLVLTQVRESMGEESSAVPTHELSVEVGVAVTRLKT